MGMEIMKSMACGEAALLEMQLLNIGVWQSPSLAGQSSRIKFAYEGAGLSGLE